jgi:hypothetical protein
MIIWKEYQPICRLCDREVTLDNYRIIGNEDKRTEVINMYIHKVCPLGELHGTENNHNRRGRFR